MPIICLVHYIQLNTQMTTNQIKKTSIKSIPNQFHWRLMCPPPPTHILTISALNYSVCTIHQKLFSCDAWNAFSAPCQIRNIPKKKKWLVIKWPNNLPFVSENHFWKCQFNQTTDRKWDFIENWISSKSLTLNVVELVENQNRAVQIKPITNGNISHFLMNEQPNWTLQTLCCRSSTSRVMCALHSFEICIKFKSDAIIRCQIERKSNIIIQSMRRESLITKWNTWFLEVIIHVHKLRCICLLSSIIHIHLPFEPLWMLAEKVSNVNSSAFLC